MKQRTLHLSFTKNDDDLFMELMRYSARNYLSTSTQARIWMRRGLIAEQNELKATTR
jgi:hypothetical protein